MLVLSRRKNETIRIGDDIVVVVVETGNGRVRIGIQAPRDVSVVRGELARRDEEEGGRRDRQTK